MHLNELYKRIFHVSNTLVVLPNGRVLKGGFSNRKIMPLAKISLLTLSVDELQDEQSAKAKIREYLEKQINNAEEINSELDSFYRNVPNWPSWRKNQAHLQGLHKDIANDQQITRMPNDSKMPDIDKVYLKCLKEAAPFTDQKSIYNVEKILNDLHENEYTRPYVDYLNNDEQVRIILHPNLKSMQSAYHYIRR